MSVDALFGYFVGVTVSVLVGLSLSKIRLVAIRNWLAVAWIGSAAMAIIVFIIIVLLSY